MSNVEVLKRPPDETAPVTAPHVLIAINAVMEDISREGIAKDRKNASQGYNFRGIDDVYNALAPILSRHKLVIKPRGLSRTCDERKTAADKPIFYVNVTMEFDLLSAVDGSRETAGPFYGEAMDSADKATNMAQSAAFKYFAMQQFCIPTEGDNDADQTTHQVEAKDPLWVVAAMTAITCINTEDECNAWYKANVAMLRAAEPVHRDKVLAYLKERKTAVTAPPPRTGGTMSDLRTGSAPTTPFDDEIPF